MFCIWIFFEPPEAQYSVFIYRSPYNPFSTTKKIPSVQPVNDGPPKMVKHARLGVKPLVTKPKTLARPLLTEPEIKREEEESPDIQEFESMDIAENGSGELYSLSL